MLGGLGALNFTTTPAAIDADGPELSFGGISPTTASAGDEVTVTWTISDATGVADAYLYLHTPQATDQTFLVAHPGQYVLVSGNATNGTYETTMTVRNVAAGVYDLQMWAIDDLGNSTSAGLNNVLTIE